jgi:hypothetical protein
MDVATGALAFNQQFGTLPGSLVNFLSARRGAEAYSDLRRMMTDRYLTRVTEEAEYVAKQHDKVARTINNQTYEFLRYAVLRVLKKRHLSAGSV